MVDGFDRNHKLGLICETKAGHGRLRSCSIDLTGLQQHPEACQLMSSILSYMESSAFDPAQEVDLPVLSQVV